MATTRTQGKKTPNQFVEETHDGFTRSLMGQGKRWTKTDAQRGALDSTVSNLPWQSLTEGRLMHSTVSQCLTDILSAMNIPSERATHFAPSNFAGELLVAVAVEYRNNRVRHYWLCTADTYVLLASDCFPKDGPLPSMQPAPVKWLM